LFEVGLTRRQWVHLKCGSQRAKETDLFGNWILGNHYGFTDFFPSVHGDWVDIVTESKLEPQEILDASGSATSASTGSHNGSSVRWISEPAHGKERGGYRDMARGHSKFIGHCERFFLVKWMMQWSDDEVVGCPYYEPNWGFECDEGEKNFDLTVLLLL
jgi:hypothetical protein